MMAAKAFVDSWLERLTSRKLLVWGTATGLTFMGHVTSEDWVVISAIYLGTQGVVDAIVRLRGGSV